MARQKQKNLFVTVGTTLFQPLVEAVSSQAAIEWMKSNNFTNLIIQYGNGRKPECLPESSSSLHVECYDFKPSLQPDLAKADWIVCHAGAGTLMEALGMAKERLVTVINSRLMDNHQTELAFAMRGRGHLQVVQDPVELYELATWERLAASAEGVPLAPGDTHDFPRIVDSFLGFAHR